MLLIYRRAPPGNFIYLLKNTGEGSSELKWNQYVISP